MKKETLSETFLKSVVVRVYKKLPDDRISLCGSFMEKDKNGREYFEIPAHLSEYIANTFPLYEIGEEFIPEPEEKEKFEIKGKTIQDNKGNVVAEFEKIGSRKYTIIGVEDKEFDSLEDIKEYVFENRLII